jgi:hypothetical protein
MASVMQPIATTPPADDIGFARAMSCVTGKVEGTTDMTGGTIIMTTGGTKGAVGIITGATEGMIGMIIVMIGVITGITDVTLTDTDLRIAHSGITMRINPAPLER